MKYKITKQAKQEALDYEKKVSKTSTLKRENYTNLSTTGRYYIGYLGEWGFAQFLKEAGIPFTWETLADGKSDDGDFLINNKKTDVKTAGKPFHKNLMFPEKQLIHHRDIYVGCRLNGEFVEVWGFIDRKTMEETPSKDFGYGIPTKSILLSDLIPIEKFENED